MSGTIRLWHLPDCLPLVFLHSKAFTSYSKQIFYTELCDTKSTDLFEGYRAIGMPDESSFNSSSIIDYSIWKMDATSYQSNIYLAFSIYAQRFHSIYLTSLTNIEQFANEQRKLNIDISYGSIVDYYFHQKNSNLVLFILFDSNMLLKIDVISILLCDQTELFAESNETIQEINNLLTQKQFHLINDGNNYRAMEELHYKQLFKNSENLNKRKTEKNEDEQRKKLVSSTNENMSSLEEYF